MTFSQTLERLKKELENTKELKRGLIITRSGTLLNEYEEIIQNLENCIEAVRKQIPEKPIVHLRDSENEFYDCPVCHQYLWSDCKQSICHHCGQALDWEGVG